MRKVPAILVFLVLLILAAAWIIGLDRSRKLQEAQIRSRYQQMRLALASGDTNTARSLFAPELRGGAHRTFGVMETFSKPLGPESSVRFTAARAQVCPETIYHYGALPGGHTIEMVRVDGQWYFTGSVHVD
jgi:hypothetical protein